MVPSRIPLFNRIFGIDIRALAFLRIGLASLILTDLMSRVRDLGVFYTDSGILPSAFWSQQFSGTHMWSLHLANGSILFQALMFLAAGLFAMAMGVGYHTRVATVLSWLFLASLHNRNPLILNGGDVYLLVTLFWGIFLPLNACWSMDQFSKPSPYPQRFLSIATLGLLLQIAHLYFFGALHKSGQAWWPEGTAVFYALGNKAVMTPFGSMIGDLPLPILKIVTYGVYAIELLGPLLLFVTAFSERVRLVALFLLMAFDLELALCFRYLGIFPWVSMVPLAVFVPSRFWDVLTRRFTFLALPPWRTNPETEDSILRRFSSPIFKLSALGMSSFLSLMIVCTLFYNVATLQERDNRFSPPLEKLTDAFMLSQNWSMYSPEPMKRNYWYILKGTFANGTMVNMRADGEPLARERERATSDFYKNVRWREFIRQLDEGKPEAYRQLYATYLCRRWNALHNGGLKLEELQLSYYYQISWLDRESSPIKSQTILAYACR